MDFQKIERKWQKRWEREKAFQTEVDKKRKKFFFTIAYPYISGSLHIGQGRAVIEGDVLVRYKRMAGSNVLWGLGFHISGTPVMGISAAIEAGDKKKTDLYKGYVRAYEKDERKVEAIVESFKDPWNIVNFFIPKMKDEYMSVGTSFDWRRSFTSGDKEHQALVTWQFNKYRDLGYLVRGSHPNLFCKEEGHAVAEDDIVDADINPVEKQEMVLLKFKFGDSYIVAATLRPETVFGQTNLWVDPNVEYVKAQVDKEKWLLSREAAEKMKSLDRKVKVLEKVPGKDLIHKKAVAPGVEREIPILPSKFTDPKRGSGIVTSVPSDAPYDWMALVDLKEDIKPIPIITTKEYGDMAAVRICKKLGIRDQLDPKLKEATNLAYRAGFHTGTMNKNCGKYAGLKVAVAKERVKEDLIREGKADIMYDTSRPAVCRCGGEVIVAMIKDQWFLDFNANDWKNKARSCLKGMEIVPHVFRKQFEDTFKWLDKRPCARRRGLGTAFPFQKGWVIESLSDSTIYMSLYPIVHKMRENKMKTEDMSLEFFDYVLLGKGKAKKSFWKEMKEDFDYWYPNDHRHTFVAHLSNHLSFFIFAHAGIFPPEKWPRKISIHGLVISEGSKMSKSKGNVITLLDATREYGADMLRAYMTGTVNTDATFDWNKKEAEAIIKNISILCSNLESAIRNRGTGKLTHIGKWFISVFESNIKRATKELEEMNLREYAKSVLYDIPNAYRKFLARAGKNEIRKVNSEIIERWIKFISPLLPHAAEELWEKLEKKGFVSLESWPKHKEKLIDPAAEASENLISQVLKDVEEIKKLSGITKPSRITIITSAPWKHEIYNLVLEGKKMKDVLRQKKYQKRGKEAVAYMQKLLKRRPVDELFLTAGSELRALEDSKPFFEQEFDCKVKVIEAERAKNQPNLASKARAAEPGKPGILVE